MKKTLIIIGIIVLILALVIGGGIFITFKVINTPKNPITADNFSSIMKDREYTVVETTEQFSRYIDYISKSYLAQKDNYQIEFYELSSIENAIDMFGTNKAKFESQKSNVSAEFSKALSNYQTYSLVTNGKYKYLSRIDNTLIYVDADETYKDEIKTAVKDLGY